MFCKKGINVNGSNSTSVVNVSGDAGDKNMRKSLYLGMSHNEYVRVFHGTLLDKLRKEKNRRKIIYVPHATWEDIGVTKTSRVYSGKIQRGKK